MGFVTPFQKRVLLIVITLITGLYLFEPISPLVRPLVEARLSFAPWFSVKNAVVLIFIYVWYKIFIAGR